MREPLFGFLLIGAAVLIVDRLAAGPGADEARIAVTPEVVDTLRATQADARGRPPTDAELAAAVDDWIADEVLVREARARGLDRHDPVIRTRLAQRMAELFDARAVPRDPTDAELQALMAAHADDYRLPTRLTVRQVFARGPEADPEARAAARSRIDALRIEAEGGADPAALTGDPPPGGPLLRGRRPARLIEQLGAEFVSGLDAAPLDRWLVRPSPAGWHLVRVERRQPGRALTFADARDRLRARWLRERAAAETDAAVEALRGRYEIIGWPPDE